MLAVFKDREKQYKVRVGDKIYLDLNDEAEEGATLEFNEVLLTADSDGVKVGAPLVKGAKVTVTVEGEFRDKKVTTIKFRKRKDSKTKRGHRQRYTEVTISDIDAG